MLEVTPAALVYMRHALQEGGAPPGAAMRLTRGDRGIDIVVDRPHPTDVALKLEGRTVLVIDELLAEAMDGERLAVVEHPSGETELCLEMA